MVVMYQCWFPDVDHCTLVTQKNVFEIHAIIRGSDGASSKQPALRPFRKQNSPL